MTALDAFKNSRQLPQWVKFSKPVQAIDTATRQPVSIDGPGWLHQWRTDGLLIETAVERGGRVCAIYAIVPVDAEVEPDTEVKTRFVPDRSPRVFTPQGPLQRRPVGDAPEYISVTDPVTGEARVIEYREGEDPQVTLSLLNWADHCDAEEFYRS